MWGLPLWGPWTSRLPLRVGAMTSTVQPRQPAGCEPAPPWHWTSRQPLGVATSTVQPRQPAECGACPSLALDKQAAPESRGHRASQGISGLEPARSDQANCSPVLEGEGSIPDRGVNSVSPEIKNVIHFRTGCQGFFSGTSGLPTPSLM